MIRYLDVCAGISASTVAWKPLGWEAAAYSEIEAAPRAVLAHHYPDTPLHGDFTTIKGDEYGAIDLLVGGTPCQDYSIAGLRAGLAGDRGNLTLEFSRLAYRCRTRWLVWENVPGVFSSNGGRDFGAVLASFAGHPLGTFFSPPDGGWRNSGVVEPANGASFGLAWRVLDAQHFGVPQRRRRVFIVGYLGDWRRAAAVLFERDSMSGHPAPRRKAGEGVARPIAAGSRRGSGYRNDADTADNLITQAFGGNNCAGPIDVSTALNSHGGPHGRLDFETETFVTATLDASYGRLQGCAGQDANHGHSHLVPVAIQERAVSENPDAGPDGAGFRTDGQAYTLEARSTPQAVAFSIMPMNSGKDYKARQTDVAQPIMAGGPVGGNQGGDFVVPINPNALRGDTRAKTMSRDATGVFRLRDPGLGVGADGDPADTLQAAGPGAVGYGSAVRRLTPRECERLQGFPNDYTLVPHRNGLMADGPRYKALGNSMAVPVMRWIGGRVQQVDLNAAGAGRPWCPDVEKHRDGFACPECVR